jgi:predicted glycoside hydrolase/deacetylase ChbG (UPF0249 family)
MTRVLILNADDYGRTPEVSRGIRRAHLQGIVTTTTVMINIPSAISDVRDALIETPSLGMGVHLNLTYGKPTAPSDRVSSLIGEDGFFLSRDHLLNKLDVVHSEHIELEWRAQIESFLQESALLDHLDSHHHIGALNEKIWQIQLNLCQEYNCATRPPFPVDISEQEISLIYPQKFVDFASSEANTMMERHGIRSADHFFASFFGETASLMHALDLLSNLPDGISELMCHPGFSDDELRSTSGYHETRDLEREILTSAALQDCVEKHSIMLRTYQTAWN